MKIAFIVIAFPALTETFILNQVTGLLDMGHDVEIFAKYNPKEKKVHADVEKYHLMERVHFLNIPRNKIIRVLKAVYLITINFYKSPIKILKSLNIFRYGKYASSLALLFRLIPLLDVNFDIIHCHYGPNGIMGMYLKKIGVEGKIITTFHGFDINQLPKQIGKGIYNKLFKYGALFTANTHFTKNQIVNLGCEEKKIVILPVGLRIERFKLSIRKIQPGEPIRILTIGRLVEKKGHEYAIKAITKVTAKYKNIVYMIVGDGPLKNKLELLVSELGTKNYIRFLGAVDQDEALRLYQQAHIFILSSVTASNGDKEGQGLVLQEAQAVGLPVISTLHNGIPEGVLDKKSGFLVPERDVDTLAERITYLIEHPKIWKEMGRRGREFVEQEYDIRKLNNRLVEVYNKVTGEEQ